MKNLLTYKQFLNESVDFSGQKVCIMPGRYAPFHLGHLAALKRCSEEFGVPVIPIQIISKNEKSPFPETLLRKIGEAVAKEFKFIAQYMLWPSTQKTVIPQMVKTLREEGYESIGMGCGSDRLNSYQSQIRFINSERTDVPVSQEFILKSVDERAEGGPSGTRVRAAIAAGDEQAFREMTPHSVHPFYKELKKYL